MLDYLVSKKKHGDRTKFWLKDPKHYISQDISTGAIGNSLATNILINLGQTANTIPGGFYAR